MNRTHLMAAILTAACSTVALSQDATRDRTVTQPPVAARPDATDARGTAAPQWPAGFVSKEAGDVDDIRERLADITEAALNKGGLSSITGYLVDQDRNRLGRNSALQSDNDAVAKLDGRIEQIQQAWRAKYGESVDIESKTALANVQVMQGEVSDPQQVLRGWPLQASPMAGSRMGMGANSMQTGNTNADNTGPAAGGNVTSDRVATVGESVDEAANLEKGRKVAIAYFPPQAKADGKTMQPITVSLIGETTAWRFDVPNTVTSEKLYQNLLDHLTKFGEMQAQWPADKAQAEAKLTYHVLQAIYDVPVQAKGQTADTSEPQR